MDTVSHIEIKTTVKGEEKSEYSPNTLTPPIKCSFSGKPADYYIGLSRNFKIDSVRIVGSVCSEMVEMAINKLLGQGLGDIQWPVVLDLDKKLVYHTHDADNKGLSAILGWRECNSKV